VAVVRPVSEPGRRYRLFLIDGDTEHEIDSIAFGTDPYGQPFIRWTMEGQLAGEVAPIAGLPPSFRDLLES
jgi:hypothetical protein